MQELLTIAAMSQACGIAKEVLRKWEERYGFPVPERDASGRRAYAEQQLVRLKLIKRLIDSGKRPSQVVQLSESSLQALLAAQSISAHGVDPQQGVMALMEVLRSRDSQALSARLKQEFIRVGLEKFVLEVMGALNFEVGAAWERGEIAIRDEHVYSETMQNLVREEILRVSQPDGRPRILLTTLTGELHTLGILMVNALASLHGACCISLGAQTPVEEIPPAVDDFHADIVCLCFSAAYPKRKISPLLKGLRRNLPAEVELWVGGAGVAGLERSPRGVKPIPVLHDLIGALNTYRRIRGLPVRACGDAVTPDPVRSGRT